jgi:MYXO-CTERM domain-containing protein
LIQSNMNAALVAASIPSTATVTGALATLNYNADGFGFGPTLGTSDGATSYTDLTHPSLATPDKFIINDNFPIFGNTGSNSITIQLTNIALGTVSFDWEIFADGTCISTPCGSNFPTMDFWVDGVHRGSTPTFSASVISGHAPQGIGVASFALNLPAGTHTLTFVDWPPEIGIDNLTIQTCGSSDRGCLGQSVPEPSPLPLAVLALALLALVRWDARRRTGATLAH